MAAQITNIVQVTVPNNEGITGTPTVFTFDFSQPVVALGLNVIFIVYEDTIVKDSSTITKSLKMDPADPQRGTAELTFPEALAGATLEISYILMSPFLIFNFPAPFTINIRRTDNLKEIEKVYWGEQEHVMWGTKLTEQEELCNNEHGFLHIYTKGMFGHDVWTRIKGGIPTPNKYLGGLLLDKIRDNVLSIPYSMASELSLYMSRVPGFTGDKLKLQGFVSKENPLRATKRSGELILHCNQSEANPVTKTSVPPVKVIIAEDEEEQKIQTKARCSLEFRPDNTYIGDYGFDWIRNGDKGIDSTFNDYIFIDCMGKYYIITTNEVQTDGNLSDDLFKYDKDPNQSPTVLNPDTNLPDDSFGDGRMFKRLSSRYKRLLFSWNLYSGTKETYCPIMTIMKGKTANLVLHLEVKVKPQKIVFEFDNSNASNFLQLSASELNSKLNVTTTLRKTHKLNITCLDEFDDEYILYARAFGENDPKGEICGILRILPNGQMYQHKVKIIIFNVQTNINGILNNGSNISQRSKNRIIELSKQALIIPFFEDLDLITTDDNQFLDNCCVQVDTNLPHTGNGINSGDHVLDANKAGEIVFILEQKRKNQYGHIHDNAIRLYFVDEVMAINSSGNWVDGRSAGGFSDSSIPGFTICFGASRNETASHELFHTLGLRHPFDGYNLNAKFTYEYCQTDNIMDYTHNIGKKRITLYHWQWQIMNLKIR